MYERRFLFLGSTEGGNITVLDLGLGQNNFTETRCSIERKTKAYALGALANLAVLENNRFFLHQHGLVQNICNSMGTWKSDPRVQHFGCLAIANMAHSDDNKVLSFLRVRLVSRLVHFDGTCGSHCWIINTSSDTAPLKFQRVPSHVFEFL